MRRATPPELDELVRIDEDAAQLFAEAGLRFEGPLIAQFSEAERRRWMLALERGLVEVASDASGRAIGFLVLGYVDGRPYLDQLSVLRAFMRRGVGRALLDRAIAGSEGAGELWLTTYAHLPWNAPMYARHGFAIVDDSRCGPELRDVLIDQRAALPCPTQRVAMVRRFR